MVLEEELLLESVGVDYPGLVREALNSKISKSTASLSDNGFVWMIIGRSLFIWCINGQINSVPVMLNLPPSGIPYSAKTVQVYERKDSSLPGVLTVSPEGIVRHWLATNRQATDVTVNLDREVALSLTPLDQCPSDIAHFLLSTTTGSFFLLSVNSSAASSTSNRQRLAVDVEVKVIHTNARSGLSGKLASALFGEGRQPAIRVLKAIVLDQSIMDEMDETDSSTVSNDRQLEDKQNLFILALTDQQLYSYSSKKSSKRWCFNVAEASRRYFSQEISSFRGELPEEIKVRSLDVVSFRNGIIILLACYNQRTRTRKSLHVALGYITDFSIELPPETFDWFTVLNLEWDRHRPIEDLLENIKFCLPSLSAVGSHDCVEGLLLVTPEKVFAIRFLDDFIGKNSIKSVHHVKYNDEFLAAGQDERYCYIFLKNKALQRLRLLPKGFDGTLVKKIVSTNRFGLSDSSATASSSDRRMLADAFRLFAEADLSGASVAVEELLQVRHVTMVKLCIDYALDIIDAIPDDERWIKSTKKSARKISNKSSFLLEVHLEEQKKRVLAMFILFMRYIGVDQKLDGTVTTVLYDHRNIRSQIIELVEKIHIAIGLYKWSKDNPTDLFDNAVKQVIQSRDINLENDLLTHHDYFFQRVSAIQEIFGALLTIEETIIGSSVELDNKLDSIEIIGEILMVAIRAVGIIREENVFDTNEATRWTQEHNNLSPFLQHLNNLFEFIVSSGRGHIKFSQLLQQATVISAFILSEQTIEERQDSEVISKFLEIDEENTAVNLAKKFCDYWTAVRLACALPDAERKSKIEEYKEYFHSKDFLEVLYEYYLKNGFERDLMLENSAEADEFFSSRNSLKWIRQIDRDQFKEASHSLKSQAQRCEDDVLLKRRQLAFAKLAALCDDEVEKELLEEIKIELRLIKEQEKVMPSMLQRFGTVEKPPKLQPMRAEEIVQAHLSIGGVQHYFEALNTLSVTILDDQNSQTQPDLIHSLITMIWLTAIRADKERWKNLNAECNIAGTAFFVLLNDLSRHDKFTKKRKMQLLPNAFELIDCLTDLKTNKYFVKAIGSATELARKCALNPSYMREGKA